MPKPAKDVIRVSVLADGAGAPAPEDLLPLLDPSEVARAQQWMHPRGKDRFVTARAAARVVLGRLLGVAPQDIPIRVAKYGKPELPHGTTGFNVSHTEGLILVAVREAGSVGVDVETLQRRKPQPSIWRRTLTPAETQALEALPAAGQWTRFLQLWSRKEAYAKGLGLGFRLDFRTIDVGWSNPSVLGKPPWQIRTLPLPDPHIGAIAAPAVGWCVQMCAHSW